MFKCVLFILFVQEMMAKTGPAWFVAIKPRESIMERRVVMAVKVSFGEALGRITFTLAAFSEFVWLTRTSEISVDTVGWKNVFEPEWKRKVSEKRNYFIFVHRCTGPMSFTHRALHGGLDIILRRRCNVYLITNLLQWSKYRSKLFLSCKFQRQFEHTNMVYWKDEHRLVKVV